jgi:gas vesicle protein
MSEEGKFSTGTVLLAFAVGGIVGAGVALLTAPQSGRETREKIKDMADDAKDKIRSLADDAKDKIRDTYRHGKDVVVERKTMISSAIEAGKKAMDEEKHRLAEGSK